MMYGAYHDPNKGWRVAGPGFNCGAINEQVAWETALLLNELRRTYP